MINNFKEQLITLYKQGFNETDEYTDFFFSRRYREENVAYVEDKGRIISALHLLPQKIMLGGRAVSAGFVSSAATLPEYRGKGVFFETMSRVYEMLKKNGMEYCFLYPFKHEYYKKHGFIEYSYVNTRVAGVKQMGTEGICLPVVYNGLPAQIPPSPFVSKYTAEQYASGDRKLFSLIKETYESVCAGFEGWVVRDDAEWEYRLNEARADKGIVLVIKSDNNVNGYAFISRGKIEECCFTDFTGLKNEESYLIDSVKELAGMEYTAPLRKKLKDAKELLVAAPFGMIKKTGCTAEQTYEFFKDKRGLLFDKY